MDMLQCVLLDYNFPLHSCTSGWAVMGGHIKELKLVIGTLSLLPAPMCKVAPRLVTHRFTCAASPAISADDRTTDQLSD